MDWTTTAAVVAAVTASSNLAWNVRDRLTTQRYERREKASGVIGRMVSLLAAVNPEAGIIGGIGKDKAFELMSGYWDRWDSIQVDLEALRVAHPSDAVGSRASEASDAIVATMTRTAWAIHEERPFAADQWDDINGKYRAAKEAVDRLRDEIRSA